MSCWFPRISNDSSLVILELIVTVLMVNNLLYNYGAYRKVPVYDFTMSKYREWLYDAACHAGAGIQLSKKQGVLPRSFIKIQYCVKPPWLRGSMLYLHVAVQCIVNFPCENSKIIKNNYFLFRNKFIFFSLKRDKKNDFIFVFKKIIFVVDKEKKNNYLLFFLRK